MTIHILTGFLHLRLSKPHRRAAGLLYAMSQLLNQAVGDAVSDMLMVEAILIHKKVSFYSLPVHITH